MQAVACAAHNQLVLECGLGMGMSASMVVDLARPDCIAQAPLHCGCQSKHPLNIGLFAPGTPGWDGDLRAASPARYIP